jgi:hypothetical protein
MFCFFYIDKAETSLLLLYLLLLYLLLLDLLILEKVASCTVYNVSTTVE